MTTWKLALPCLKATAPLWEEVLAEHCPVLTRFEAEEDSEDWWLEGYWPERPDANALDTVISLFAASQGWPAPAYTLEKLTERDWVAENQRNFPPIRVGRFYIHGTHHPDKPPAACLPLKIDAAMAFGTGDHATTKGCLRALTRLHKLGFRPRTGLDIGCGTAILAMGAVRLWPASRWVASDLDPPSVVVARVNTRRNQVARPIRCVLATGYRHPAIRAMRPCPLILANILARPLCDLAPALAHHLARGGYTIASGLLVSQQNRVIHAYQKQGLILRARDIEGHWATLTFQKRY